AGKLSERADLCNLKNGKVPQLSKYDKVIIGGSVYVGKVQKEVREFCSNNLALLKEKKVGLFTCGMQQDAVETAFASSFPKELLSNAAAKECFGGEFIFKKMNFLEKMIVKKIAGTDKDVLNVSEAVIDRFAQSMNHV
ncbi:MAG: flavodoxin, partial [Clostridiales bacterium]|nr:flavodoxin [Clostridiales bacterium]